MMRWQDVLGVGRGALAVAGVAGTGLLAEVKVAQRRSYLADEMAPPVAGEFGPAAGPALRLVVLGDSTGAGLGADSTSETVGAWVAQGLAADGWRVTLRGTAVSGARTADLRGQGERTLRMRPDVALMLIGANDATHATDLNAVRRHTTAVVGRLVDAGVPTVVGTCPEMGAAAFLPPLRQVASWQGRRVGAAQGRAVYEAGGIPVDLAAEVGPAFRDDPERLLAADAFHPSGAGYRLWAEALLPTVRAVVPSQDARPAAR